MATIDDGNLKNKTLEELDILHRTMGYRYVIEDGRIPKLEYGSPEVEGEETADGTGDWACDICGESQGEYHVLMQFTCKDAGTGRSFSLTGEGIFGEARNLCGSCAFDIARAIRGLRKEKPPQDGKLHRG